MSPLAIFGIAFGGTLLLYLVIIPLLSMILDWWTKPYRWQKGVGREDLITDIAYELAQVYCPRPGSGRCVGCDKRI